MRDTKRPICPKLYPHHQQNPDFSTVARVLDSKVPSWLKCPFLLRLRLGGLPWPVAQLIGALSGNWGVAGSIPCGSGHVPGLWVWSLVVWRNRFPVQAHGGQLVDASLSYQCPSCFSKSNGEKKYPRLRIKKKTGGTLPIGFIRIWNYRW